MESSDLQNGQNIQRGCLKLNDKLYPVYEGHNTIGRNREAIINIKNVNISQHHAVITVVDENTHFISDFKSSNGTVVDNKKLCPLKLYPLNNGSSIKFADVFCTYKKLQSNEKISKNSEASQNFSDSFYGANTQTVNLPNSDEMNVNEMPTQVMALHPDVISIHEMPTQIFTYDTSLPGPTTSDEKGRVEDDNNSSNDSIDFITMQKTSESQAFTLNKKKIDSDNEELSTVQQASLESDVAPVQLNPKRKILSDSEKSTPDMLLTEKAKAQDISEIDEEPVCSQICPVRTGIKSSILSDSGSDTDEYTPQISTSAKRKSKYAISDDDETDIEDGDKCAMNDSDIIPNTQNGPKNTESSQKAQNQVHSFTESFRLEVSEIVEEQKDENLNEKDQEKNIKEVSLANEAFKSAIAEDHIYCRPSENEDKHEESRNSAVCETGGLSHLTSTSEDKVHENDKPETTFADFSRHEIIQKNNYEKSDVQEPNSLATTVTNDQISQIVEDWDDEATQELAVAEDMKIVNDNKENSNTQNVDKTNNEKTEDDNVSEQSTEEIVYNFINKSYKGEIGECSVSHIQEQKITENNKETLTDKDIFATSTQQIDLDNKNDKNIDDEEKITENNKETLTEKDIFATSTQQIDSDLDNKNDKNIDEEEKITESNKEKLTEDDIFAKPTQEINLDLNNKNDKDIDDIYLQPTQEISMSVSCSNHNNIDEDDIYLQPTQEINLINLESESRVLDNLKAIGEINLEKNKNEPLMSDSYEVPEKNVATKEHEFLLPHLPDKKINVPDLKSDNFLVPSLPSTSKKYAVEEDDDELFLPPTQALEILHQDENPVQEPETGPEPKEVEDQLQMLFASQSDHMFVATQQLVEVLEAKNDDIIEDSMLESNDVNKSKFESVESIRKILDESVSEDDDHRQKEKFVEENVKDIDNVDEHSDVDNKKDVPEKTKQKKAKEKGKSNKEKCNAESILDVQSTKASDNKSSQDSTSSSCSTDSKSSNKKKKTIKPKDQIAESKKSEEKIINTRSTRRHPIEELDDKLTEKTNRPKENAELENKKEESDKEVEDTSNVKKTKRNTVTNPENEDISQKKNIEIEQKREANTRSKKSYKTEVTESKPEQNTRNRKKTGSNIQTEKQEEKENTTKNTKRKANSKLNLEEKSSEAEFKNVGNDEEPYKRRKTKESEIASNDEELIIRRKTRGNSVVSTASEQSNDDKESSTSRMGRNKRTTSSEDEFMPKIPKIDSAKRTPGRPSKKKIQAESTISEQVPETPTTRKSARTRKINLVDDEVISVSSSSTVNEVISIPSSSSTPISPQPTKRGRKLSANSRALKNEEEKSKKKGIQDLSPILGTPERGKRTQKPKVVFTMLDSPELESLIRQLGGSVVDTVDASTVLVTESVKRSQKLLRAVGLSKPICSPQWLLASKKAFKFLDPWDYILVDKEAEKKWNFSLRESLERSSKTKLLDNYTFQIMVTTATDVLKGAIEACGGKCVNRNLTKAGTDNLIIVANGDQKNKFAKIIKENPEIKVVEPEAIFDGTLRQEFRFNQHLLT